MYKKLLIFVAIVLSVFLINACKSGDNVTDPPDDQTNYFPNADGNHYKYDVSRTDSSGSNQLGTRSSTFSGTNVIGGVTYQVKIDSSLFAGIPAVEISYFRKTDAGVYFFLDTTGLSDVIPDSLLQNITIDGEMIAYSFPFTDGKQWPVFKMQLNLGFINITVVEVTGYYEGIENLPLNLASGAANLGAAKIRYSLKLQVPDPQNPFSTISQEFTAYSWLAADIGAAKWEGNGTLINVFTGGGIDFDDTTSVISQSLTDFDVN
jgi:hypothetical protein